MAYATCDDVLRRYPPLKSMIGTSTLDVSTVDVASIYIADGESIINGYLGKKYIIPLSNEPIITDLCSDIAIYRIVSDKQPRIPDWMDKRYTNVMSMLAMLRDGGMVLNASSQTANSGGDEFAWSNVIDPDFVGTVFKPIETTTPCNPSWNTASADYLTF
jgi:phage gp36-like protein